MRFGRLAFLAAIVLVGIAFHTLVIAFFPVQQTFGDEASYTVEAHRMLDTRFSNLLPGNMISHHRPSLGFSYFSLYAQPELIRYPEAGEWIIDSPHETWSAEMARFMRRVSFSNLALLSLASILAFLLSRECGFRLSASVTAAALMMFNPRTGFYVQSVWPEILHFTLVLAAVWVFSLALRRQRERHLGRMLGWLLLCGVLLAYARLTRGVVEPLAWAMAAMVAWIHLHSEAAAGRIRQLGWALLAAAVLLVSFEGTLWPQRLANHAEYGSTLIGHNLWRNIEGGVARTQNYPTEYMNASPDPLQRERLARKRVMERVPARPLNEIAARQVRSFFNRLTVSYFDRGFRSDRWRQSSAKNFVTRASAVFSWGIFAMGLTGLVLRGFRSRTGVVLSLFTLYYIAGLLVVIPNPRMFVQLVPPLVIFSAGTLDVILSGFEQKRGPAGSSDSMG